LYDESYRFFLEFLGKRTPDHGLALQTTRYLLFEPSKGIEPLHSLLLRLCAPLPRGALFLALRYLLASLRRLASSPRRLIATSPRRRAAPRVRACREFIVVRTAISSDDFGRGA
ncbi:hypothetical protein, partial [Burkholderia pseudomallei]|uniref:hypothetical protein n=1 Tax=Burkholderia pseudomallei TaxID=28450 RepID=UPI0023621E28